MKDKPKIESIKFSTPFGSSIGIIYLSPVILDEIFNTPEEDLKLKLDDLGEKIFKNHTRVLDEPNELRPLTEKEIKKLSPVELFHIAEQILPNEDTDPLDIDSGPFGNPFRLLAKRVIHNRTLAGKSKVKIGQAFRGKSLISEATKEAIDRNLLNLKKATSSLREYPGSEWDDYLKRLDPRYPKKPTKSEGESTNLIVRPPLILHEKRTADATEASLKELEQLARRIEVMTRSMGELTGTVGQAAKEFVNNVERQKSDADRAFRGAKWNLRVALGALVISASLPIVQMVIDYQKSIGDGAREAEMDALSKRQNEILTDMLMTLRAGPVKAPSAYDFSLNARNLLYSKSNEKGSE